MTTKIKIFLLVLGLFCLPAFSSTTASELPIEVVTYSNFNYILYVTSSLKHTYFATTEGIIRYNNMEESWAEPLTGTYGIDHQDIRRIWVDKFDEKLFAQTGSFLYEYDFLFEKWFPLSELPAFEYDFRHIKAPEFFHPPSGYIYSPDGSLTDAFGRDYVLTDLINDGSGNIWIGSWGLGPMQSSELTSSLELLPYGLLQKRVDAILNDMGTLWVGGYAIDPVRSGVTIFNPDDDNFSYIESGLQLYFPVVNISCFEQFNDLMVIGSDNGVYFVDKEKFDVSENLNRRDGITDNKILSLLAIGDTLLVGTANGMNMVTSSGKDVQLVYPSEFINKVIYDFQLVDSSVWIASSYGVYRMAIPSGKLQQFQDNEMFIFNDVYDIEQFDDFLFFSTNSGVLQLNIMTAEMVTHPSQSHQFTPRKLAVNEKIIALGSNDGLTIIFYDNDPPYSRTFTTEDGFPSNRIYSLEMDGDFLWIGTDNGLSRFWWNNPSRVD